MQQNVTHQNKTHWEKNSTGFRVAWNLTFPRIRFNHFAFVATRQTMIKVEFVAIY